MRLAYLVSGSLMLAACATTHEVPLAPRMDAAIAWSAPVVEPIAASGPTDGAATDSAPVNSGATSSSATNGAPTSSAPTAAVPAKWALLPDVAPFGSDDSPQGPPRGAPPQGPPARSGWRPGEAALQGYIGASFLTLDTTGGSIANINDDDVSFPTIGGGGQWKLAGDRVDFGLESLFSFSWRGNVAAVAIGGGGAAIAVDVDLLLWDVYGGAFVNAFLGDRTRVYAGAGPLLRWTIYDQDGPSAFTSGDGDGFGFGYYARTGIEFALSRGTMIGFCARWTDVEIDLSGRLGDLEMHGIEALVTITQGF